MTASVPRYEPRRTVDMRPLMLVIGLAAAAAAALALLLAGYSFLKAPVANLLGPPTKSAVIGLEKVTRGATGFLGTSAGKPSPSAKTR